MFEQMTEHADEMERQLADARDLFESSKRARKSLSDACDSLQAKLTEAREQRDMFAEALQSCVDAGGNFGDLLAAARGAKSALAAVKGGSQ